MFSGLSRLERLKLNDNRLQTIENGSLDELTGLNKLELSDNSFVCNCSLTW
jgi:Leucine-rich repeat (LRR) protein